MTKLSQAFAIYAATFVLGFIAVSLLAYHASARFSPSPSGELYNKYLYINDNLDKYDILFLGDSRAFCAVQPERVDAVLGTSSFNLAHWTNWFPTQYPLVRDLAPHIPDHTTVVLFVGHINFFHSKIFDKYPITLPGIPEYLETGFSLLDIYDNIASFNPLLRFYHKRATVRTLFLQTMDQPLLTREAIPEQPHATTPLTTDLDLRIQALSALPEVAFVEVLRDKGDETSIALHKNNGSYERVEINEQYFRNKQKTARDEAKAAPPPAPDVRYVKLFWKMLKAFKDARVNLIIVELEEAPHTYGSPSVRDQWRAFVRSIAKPAAEESGFHYITLPLEAIPDAGYFDYNHMNSKGVDLFTSMLVKAIAPHIARTCKDCD